MTTGFLTVSVIPWNKNKLYHHGLCTFIILEAVKVRMADEKGSRNTTQMLKYLALIQCMNM